MLNVSKSNSYEAGGYLNRYMHASNRLYRVLVVWTLSLSTLILWHFYSRYLAHVQSAEFTVYGLFAFFVFALLIGIPRLGKYGEQEDAVRVARSMLCRIHVF